MIESIYVDSENIEGLDQSNANHLMVIDRSITAASWAKLQKLGCRLSIAIDAFEKGDCPVNPNCLGKLSTKIETALQFSPGEIWLDRFRFGGDCTDIEDSDASKAHQPCQFCKNAHRVDYINALAETVREQVNGRAELGFFAVAFKSDKSTRLRNALGLDYAELGKIFDISSPMLYHEMIRRPISYIAEYVKWMAEITGKPVLPIIQIKSMPDDLTDSITEQEIKKAFSEAKKKPSLGVAIFWWEHALEKNKTKLISELFKG